MTETSVPPPARGVRPLPSVPPVDQRLDLPLFSWSASRGGAGEVHYRAPVHLATVAFTAHPRSAARLASDRAVDHRAPAGASWLVPAGTEFWTAWREPAEWAQITVTPLALSGLADELSSIGMRPLAPILNGLDEALPHIFRLARAELEAGAGANRLYLEGLGMAALARMLRISAGHGAGRPVRGGLPAAALRRVRALVQEDPNPADLSLGAMAEAAGLSRFHFLRAFRASTGLTPAEYVMRERVARAAVLLATTSLTVSEIARLAGFGSLDACYRAFAAVKGTTPAAMRRR